MEKRCGKCGRVKPLDEFYLDKNKRDGHSYRCKECTKQNTKDHYKNNRDECVLKLRIYYQNHREESLRRSKEYHKAHRAEHNEYNNQYRQTKKGVEVRKKERDNYRRNHAKELILRARIYRERYPEKRKAHQSLSYAVKTGRLPSASSQKCVVCKTAQAQEYHHHNGYAEDHWLDVIPVCSKCHKVVEKNHTSTN